MTARIIRYIPKLTSARTQYREITEEDQQWLQVSMIEWLTRMAELDQSHDEDSKYFLAQWWHRRSKTLHRGQQGPNTPCSTVGGILNNMMFKHTPQRDFSDKQMADIEAISHVLAQAIDCTAIRFQVGFAE